MPEVSIMTTTTMTSHHPSKIGDEAAALSPTTATTGTDDSWEMITNPIDMVVGVPSPCHNNHLVRKTSSCLDFRQLEVVNEKRQDNDDDDDDDECCGDSFVKCGDGDSIVMVSSPPSVISASTSTTITTTNNKILSFRDAILAKSNTNTIGGVPPRIPTTQTQIQQPRRKMKPKFVVTPIKRCTRSTPNLRALISLDDYEDNGDDGGGSGGNGTSCIINEEEEILGATDATEYYQQKAHGAHGRKTSMKERPDEAKRREMIQYKKGLQRQNQQQRAKGGGGSKKKSSTKGSNKK